MNKIIAKLSILSLLAIPATQINAGIQNGRTIYESIGLKNDTLSSVIVDTSTFNPGQEMSLTLKPGQEISFGQPKETPERQLKKTIKIYVRDAQQLVSFSYYTYGIEDGKVSERIDGRLFKVSELLKEAQHKKEQKRKELAQLKAKL